jgi:S1-C subfamily serine protease
MGNGARSARGRGWFGLGIAASLLVGAGGSLRGQTPAPRRPAPLARPLAPAAQTPKPAVPPNSAVLRPPLAAPPRRQPTAWTNAPTPEDDRTFRPTVLVRKGTSKGSGSVIASIDQETLVLTAAHVVAGPGKLWIELHRFNLGLETTMPAGAWPRLVPAEIAAADRDADIAVLRVRGLVALPFVAQIADEAKAPAPGAVVTSLGFDQATYLRSWSTWVVEVSALDMDHGGGERLFLLTSRVPEEGRSGGGLFNQDGQLIGVCTGRIEIREGRWAGLFSAGSSVRRLIREPELAETVNRSNTRHSSPALADHPDRPRATTATLPPRPDLSEIDPARLIRAD